MTVKQLIAKLRGGRQNRFRVNVNGTTYEDKWASMTDAVAGAMRRHEYATDGSSRDLDDMVIHVERVLVPPGFTRRFRVCTVKGGIAGDPPCGSLYEDKFGCCENGHPRKKRR